MLQLIGCHGGTHRAEQSSHWLGVCEAGPGKDVTTPAHWVVSEVFRGTQTLSRWMTLGKIKDEEQVTEIPSYLFWSGCCYTAFAGLIVFIH